MQWEVPHPRQRSGTLKLNRRPSLPLSLSKERHRMLWNRDIGQLCIMDKHRAILLPNYHNLLNRLKLFPTKSIIKHLETPQIRSINCWCNAFNSSSSSRKAALHQARSKLRILPSYMVVASKTRVAGLARPKTALAPTA